MYSLPWTRRDPSTIADKASMSASLYRRRDGTILDSTNPMNSSVLVNPLSAVHGKSGTVSLCEERLMYAMDELPDPLKTVRDICRQ